LSTTNIPEEVNKPSRIRRTKAIIARENKQILDYIIKGATHEQIMKWIGLSEAHSGVQYVIYLSCLESGRLFKALIWV
jgi:hypothetical protein